MKHLFTTALLLLEKIVCACFFSDMTIVTMSLYPSSVLSYLIISCSAHKFIIVGKKASPSLRY